MTVQYADTAIESFLELERRFVDFTRLIPVAPEHLRVHSPVLASILLDACSLTETTLKLSMDNARYNAVQNIAAIRAMRNAPPPPYLNIGHLRSVFRPDTLYSKPVWFLPRGASSYPWYAWRQPQGNPAWWGAYNKVKHNRFENAHLATLGTTMHAMKGLFLVIIQALDFRERLVDRGMIRREKRTVADLKADVSAWEVFTDNWHTPVLAMSNVFGYRFLSRGAFAAHAKDASVFL